MYHLNQDPSIAPYLTDNDGKWVRSAVPIHEYMCAYDSSHAQGAGWHLMLEYRKMDLMDRSTDTRLHEKSSTAILGSFCSGMALKDKPERLPATLCFASSVLGGVGMSSLREGQRMPRQVSDSLAM